MFGARARPLHVQHFQYNDAQQMWLYRTFTCEADVNGAPVNPVGVSAWEFRYAGDGQRYLVRQRDATLPASWPADPPYLRPIGDGQKSGKAGHNTYSAAEHWHAPQFSQK